MSDRPTRLDGSWTRSNLLTLTALTAAAFAWMTLLWPGRVPCTEADPPPDRCRLLRASQRVDPNTASPASLRRLPMIGLAKARAIVAFRQSAASQPAFRTADDLSAVSGIGPATVQRLRPHLRLGPPAPAPTAPPTPPDP